MDNVRPDPQLALEYCAERPIFVDFLQQAKLTPDATAVVSHEATYSYRQLEETSRRIAALLILKGAAASDRVVIVSNRCAGLVSAMLGASRAGLIFSVADMAYPAARIEQILRVLEPAFVLLCGEADFDIDLKNPGPAPRRPYVVRIPETHAHSLQAFTVESEVLPEVNPGQAAYITFTSGSTGEPKGIVTHHAPLVHFIEWHTLQHSLTKEDCFSLLSGLGHDPVYRDVFTPLSIGAKVIIPAQSTVVNPSALATWLLEKAISVVHLTPPLGKLIETGAKLAGARFDDLRCLFWGGDALSETLYKQMCAIAPNASSVNFYGTTETPQAMAFHPVDPAADNSRIPLGKGIEGAQLLVVNECGQLAQEGEVGEILIRSPYLSLGYWGDTGQTREKFVINPFTHVEDDICYKTGDLGTYLVDGSVTFLGRGDSQVKIRGHRIELTEIEGAVARHPRVKQCVVLATNENASIKLVAYCVLTTPVSSVELREFVSNELPDYMVPALFVFLDAIPLTPNGKIDKRGLSLTGSNLITPSIDEDLSPLGVKLAQAWSEILEVPHIDTRLSFVELGGDSLSFVQASMVLERLIGQLPDQWEMIPVRDLSELTVAKPSRFSFLAMEVPVLLRVMAILLIVVGHFHVFSNWYISGETSVLFIVSGLSLARFQLKAINERGNARALLKSAASIAVPTVLYTILTQVLFDRIHWQSILMISNWFTRNAVGDFTYWYIEVLLQMILIIGFVLSFESVRKAIMSNPFRHLVLAACLLAVADLLINTYVFDATALFDRVPQHYLAIMVLGMAIHYAHSNARKLIVSAVAILVIGAQDILRVFGHEAQASGYIDIAIPAILAVIWIRSVPVPGIIARGLALIAASTLFIYLTHFQFQSLARRIDDTPALAVVIAIIGGIGVGYAWNKLLRIILLRWSGGTEKARAEKIERVA
jgi:amino acid adenylation domain-containing protein